MLVSFKINNFLSFNKEQVFSMVPSLNYDNDFHINQILDVKLLKMGIILGANSSGKSNLLKALEVGSSLVRGDDPTNYKNFFCKINKENKDRETLFEYSFYINKEFYTYGFSINLNSSKFLSEYLYVHDRQIDQEKVILERITEENKIENLFTYKMDISVNLRKKINKYIKDFRNTSDILFITKLNQDREINLLKDYRNVFTYFSSKINIYFQNQDFKILDTSFKEKEKQVNELLNYFDTGISEIICEEIEFDFINNHFKTDYEKLIEYIESKKEVESFTFSVRIKQSLFCIEFVDGRLKAYKILLKHFNADLDFEFFEESDGIRRLFDLFDILLTPRKDSIYLFDELSRSLHPLLIIKFLDTVNKNLSNFPVQLVFSTHEANILKEDLLRKDEIWFVEKKRDNESKLYSLDIFKLSNKKMINSYLDGNYGAVPVFLKDEE